MKLSIIIPAYKSEKSIIRCLESIIKGAGQINYEVIVISDDVETKDKEALRKSINDIELSYGKKIELINNNSTKGVGGARNTGLELATGEYVWFVDSDDNVADSWGKQIEEYIQDSKADLIIAGYVTVNNGRVVEKHLVPNINQINIKEFICEYMQSLQMEWLLNPVWNKIFMRATIERLRFEENCSMGEDLSFCFSFLQRAKTVVFIPGILYTYRIGENDNSLCKSFHTEAMDMTFINWKKEAELLHRYGVMMHPQVTHEYCAARNAYEKAIITEHSGKLKDLIDIQKRAKNMGFPGAEKYLSIAYAKYIKYKYISMKMLMSRIKHGRNKRM